MRELSRRIFASLVVIFWLSFILSCQATALEKRAEDDNQRMLSDTREYLRRLEKLGFAGVVLIARDGTPLLAQGYGLADREHGIRWTPATVSSIGSITKQFTGAGILKLQEDGLLCVNDSISKYFQVVPEDKRAITLHHLLTHSSGLIDPEKIGDWDPIGRDEYVRLVLDQPLAFPPGQGYEYANANFSLLAAIIEQLTAKPYEKFIRERLFLPCGMYETGYVLPVWGDARMAQGYRGNNLWGTVLGRPMAEDGPYWGLRGNGGIHSTAYDMLRWAIALTEGRVLSRESMEAYWKPHVSEGGDSYYGYGWVVMTGPGGEKIITHNGGNMIFFADMAIVPERKLVVFLQTNVIADVPGVNRLLEKIGARILVGKPYPEIPDVADIATGTITSFAGRYKLAGNAGEIIITADGNALVLEAEGQRAFSFLHSVEPIEIDRIERLNQLLDRIMVACRTGNFEPIEKAYQGRVSRERLSQRWKEMIGNTEERLGPLRGHEILGTARMEERDETEIGRASCRERV
jgi:CubicO group peptidase (beta-lactamase class C family)